MERRTFLVAASALGVLVFALTMLLLQPRLAGVRADFTENNLYTLSDGTGSVLRDLVEPVEITLVYSRSVGQEYPAVRAYAARVRELLAAYGGVAGQRRLIIREIDPTPFSEAEDEALAAGITALDTGGGDPLYFGVIGRNAVDDEAVIPFLSPERENALEYSLTRLISRLDNPEPATIGVLTTLDGMEGDGRDRGYFVLREMAKSFRIERLPEDFVSIPEEVDVLLLAHPPSLTERQSWLIDQFVLREGRLIAFIDPAAKSVGTGSLFRPDPTLARSGLGRLAESWGVELTAQAVADVASALPVEVDDGEGRTTVIGQPLFIAAPPAQMSETDLATADLSRAVHFGAPGALSSISDVLTFTPLITTSESPSLIDAQQAARDMTPVEVVAAYEALESPLILAARLSGTLETAFPGGAPPLELPDDPALAEIVIAAAGEELEPISESAVPAEIILVADVDLLDDGFYVDPSGSGAIADNAAFVLNALDGLAGDAELLSLRARAPSARPMTRVDDMRAAAEARYFDEQARLEARLRANQDRLNELQEIGSTDGFYAGDLEADLTPEEQAELASLRRNIVDTRERLRAIERDYRKDIDQLEGTLKALNIWGPPLLVALIGCFVWFRRRGRG